MGQSCTWAAHPWQNCQIGTELRYFCTIATHSTEDSMHWRLHCRTSKSFTRSKRIRLSRFCVISYCVAAVSKSHRQVGFCRGWLPDGPGIGSSSLGPVKQPVSLTLPFPRTFAKYL